MQSPRLHPPLDVDDLGTVLGVWAHPDDESFLAAGLAARIIDRGGTVACVTATRGERGTSDPITWPPDRLGRRRARELQAALAVVGVTDHEFLGWVDGTLHHVPDRTGAARVHAAIDRVRPDTVVTFGPDGWTGHGDHAAVSRWTTMACRDVATPVRLLYATSNTSFSRAWADVNTRTNSFAPGFPVATPDHEIALELELDADERDRKVVAMVAQSSQFVPVLDMIGEDALRGWVGVESFRLAPAHLTPPGRSPANLVEAAPAAIWP